MLLSKSEMLTARFYEWEQRGRGWHVFDCPVELEPVFHPFFGHYVPTPKFYDDSRRPTLLSALVDLFKPSQKVVYEDNSHLVEIPPVSACPDPYSDLPIAYSVVLPKNEKIAIADMEHLLVMLSYTERPVSFEIIGTKEAIRLQYTCRGVDERTVYAQIKAYFPKAVITKNDEGLDLLLKDTNACVVDFGLREEFMRPMNIASESKQDSYTGLFAALEYFSDGECGAVQVLFKGTVNPWATSIMRAVSDSKGGSFFEDDPDMPKLAREKVSSALFAVSIRAIGQSNERGRPQEITKSIANAIVNLSQSRTNVESAGEIKSLSVQGNECTINFQFEMSVY